MAHEGVPTPAGWGHREEWLVGWLGGGDLFQIGEGHDLSVHWGNAVHSQPHGLNLLVQICRRRPAPGRRIHIGLDQEALGRQIGDEHPLVVRIVLEPANLHHAVAVAELEHLVARHGFDHELGGVLCEAIRLHGVWARHEALVPVCVDLVGDDRQPFGDRGTQAA